MLKTISVNKKLLVLFSTVTILLISSMCFGATYYVDATHGIDNNSGLSPETPWKTIAKVNSSIFQPGDYILCERGEIWREQLNVPSSGTKESPITFGAYGTGDRPIISGSDIFNNGNWIKDTDNNNIWRIASPTSSKGIIVVIDSKKFLPVPAKNQLKDYNYFYDTASKMIYVYLTDDPDRHLTEISTRSDCIINISKKHIIIQDIKCQYSYYAGIRLMGSQPEGYCIIKNCQTYHNRIFGIVAQAGHEHATIENCQSSFNGVNLYTMNSNYNTFRNNVSHSAIRYTSSPFTDGTGFGNQESDYTIFEGNEVYDNFSANGVEAWHGKDLTIDKNFIYNNGHHGISLDYTSGDINITRNVVTNNGKGDYQAGSYGILLWTHNTANIYLYNNTIYNDNEHAYGFAFNSGNIIAKNNIVYVSRADKYCLYVEGASDFVSDYNNFYNSASKNIIFNYGAYSLAAWKAKKEDSDDNSISEEPLFIDALNNEFRLQKNSPCVDAGTDMGLTIDHDGNPVPMGIAPDMGAYEQQKGSVAIKPPGNLHIEFSRNILWKPGV